MHAHFTKTKQRMTRKAVGNYFWFDDVGYYVDEPAVELVLVPYWNSTKAMWDKELKYTTITVSWGSSDQ